ncbi:MULTISPECIES: hypothetical protein [Acidobacteriaceae]|uniref:WD40/YVTN/BNR-like repeat-containing protein n=1 Tax=Acidobacteriaceae TaxID=204434 RepID=UPI001C20BA8D|nr:MULTISPECIES: hypothetical protein [Acidobacteriaceae]MDW5264366.1 hypothetical protein [Edaphobacter sp.]
MNTLTRRYRFQISFLALFLAFTCLRGNAATWLPFGPDGGDARTVVADPLDASHLYLGALNGWIYESHDRGHNWKRLALVGGLNDLVLDSIVIDKSNPKHILVGAWVLGSTYGGLYDSKDGGITWSSDNDMKGQSIRSLAASSSDSRTVIAGTLLGVYRSTDSGVHWKLISPEGSKELHEVESIAIDPVDPQIIYAGTWHLPWKTTDGGEHWKNIKEGIIDDSDVFSIIVDPKQPTTVYASACSGIYKSEDQGLKFQKIQGIPSTARRTRVLMQDPQHLNIVFAGTTEGLFRSSDSGKSWLRTTGPEVIVNDVYVDPSDANRVLLATDRGGVLASNDGGMSFLPSNSGFSSRQIVAYVQDDEHPATIYVGVVNDKEWGGVFVSNNGGLTWNQLSAGLNGSDVFSLGQASDGTIIAGTAHGLYRLQGQLWNRVDGVSLQAAAVASPKRLGARRSGRTAVVAAPRHLRADPFDGSVNAIARSGDTLYAATTDGLLQSVTAGQNWQLTPGLGRQSWRLVAAARSMAAVADLNSVSLSMDNGQKWKTVSLPSAVTQLAAVAVDGAGSLWIGGREGVFFSEDEGATWHTMSRFSIHDVSNLFYDARAQRILITANNKNTIVYAVHLPDRNVQYWNAGWSLRLARPVGDHLVGATLFDGIVVQPRMVASKEVSSNTEASTTTETSAKPAIIARP